MLRFARAYPKVSVLIGMTLPGLIAAIIEYLLTNGVSGVAAIPSAIVGGLVSAVVLIFLNRSVPSQSPQPIEQPQDEGTFVPTIHSGLSEPAESQGSVVQLSGDRFFSPRTPAELVAELEGKTDLVAKDLTKRHMGHWMRVNGQINDVEDQFPDVVVYLRETQSQPMMALSFEPDLWKSRLGSLNLGDQIEAIGKINRVGSGWVRLEECELVLRQS